MKYEKISDLGVIVVAGGASVRYGSNKLLEKLADAPVLVHSLRNYHFLAGELVLAAAETYLRVYEKLISEFLPDVPVKIVPGGSCRAKSVSNALAALGEDIRFAAVHDAARPLGTAEQLKRLYDYAVAHRCGVISGRRLADSLKRIDASGVVTENVSRENLFRAETPQLFEAELLRAALAQNADESVTDDAEAMRRAGFPVAALEDPDPNPKLTRPEDLELLKKLIFR